MRTGLIAVLSGLILSLAGCNSAREADLRAGYEALEQKQYDQAQAAADRYLAETPEGRGAPEALYLRGRSIEQRIKHTDAEAFNSLMQARDTYQQALKLNPPRHLEAYIQTSLGNVCYWLDDYATAEVQWTAAYEYLERDDLKSWVLYRIGLCQQRLGKWGAADGTFASVERQFPGTVAADRARAHRGAREFYVQVGAFQSIASADKLVATLRGQGFPALRLAKPEKSLQLVMAGPLPDYRRSIAMRDRLNRAGYRDVMIVP